MSRISMNRMICRMALILTVVSLAGCGLKGPLYFPPAEQPHKPVTPISKPAGSKAQQAAPTDSDLQSAQ